MVVANLDFSYTSSTIVESRTIMLGLCHEQVIHKGSECLDFYWNTSVILPLASFLDVQFCRSCEMLLQLVGLPTFCQAVDLVADCCVDNHLCLCSL